MKFKKLNLNDTAICTVAMADNYFLRLRGMLGRKYEGFDAIHIAPCNQVHTHFMAFPVDLVYTDKDGTILKKEENIKPWVICKAVKGAYATIEFAAGKVSEYGIDVGMKLIPAEGE